MDRQQFAFLIGALARLDAKMEFIFKWAIDQLEENEEHVTVTEKDTVAVNDDADL